MERIEEDGEELLTVVLLTAFELGVFSAEGEFELFGRQLGALSLPNAAQNGSERGDEFVGGVSVFDVEEVIDDGRRSEDALKAAVHVTCVADVSKADDSGNGGNTKGIKTAINLKDIKRY